MVWYSHLFKNFPVCCDPHKGFGIVSEADVFLEFSCFLDDPADVGDLISGSSVLSLVRIWSISQPPKYSCNEKKGNMLKC